MLELDRLGRSRSNVARTASDRVLPSHGQRFALGGVAFELLTASPGPGRSPGFVLEPDTARYCVPSGRHPVVADVLCSVAIDDARFEGASRFGGLELPSGTIDDLSRGELELRAPRVHATLCRLAPQRYACSARIASDPLALSALLRSIVAIVVHDAGGVMVHAAGIVLDQQAVIYVGPSGAGKSTAATLTDRARMFACDHVALLPQRAGGVLAYGMPGGSTAAMSQTSEAVWPLGAVFRILRDGPAVPKPHTPRVTLLQSAEALFTMREAVESPDESIAAEQKRLAAVAAIASATKVGTLHTVLGASIGQLVREQLTRQEVRA